jgi:hypothetical protein
MATVEQVTADALSLSDDERAEVADILLESLHPPGYEPEELAKILRQRTTDLAAGRAKLRDIEDALAALRRMKLERRTDSAH